MAGLDNEQTLLILHFMPAQGALGAHKPLENLRFVAGMEHDQPHAPQHPLLHPRNNFIGHAAMLAMTPPDQHVRVLQQRFGQAGLGLAQIGGANHKFVLMPLKGLANACVQPFGIYVQHLGALVERVLITVFRPNSHMNGHE